MLQKCCIIRAREVTSKGSNEQGKVSHFLSTKGRYEFKIVRMYIDRDRSTAVYVECCERITSVLSGVFESEHADESMVAVVRRFDDRKDGRWPRHQREGRKI